MLQKAFANVKHRVIKRILSRTSLLLIESNNVYFGKLLSHLYSVGVSGADDLRSGLDHRVCFASQLWSWKTASGKLVNMWPQNKMIITPFHFEWNVVMMNKML